MDGTLAVHPNFILPPTFFFILLSTAHFYWSSYISDIAFFAPFFLLMKDIKLRWICNE